MFKKIFINNLPLLYAPSCVDMFKLVRIKSMFNGEENSEPKKKKNKSNDNC